MYSLARARSRAAENPHSPRDVGTAGSGIFECIPVDGYNPKTKTVFQYQRCHWHGCRKCFPIDRDKIIAQNDQAREDQLIATFKGTNALRKAGYRVIEVLACEVGEIAAVLPRTQTTGKVRVVKKGTRLCSCSPKVSFSSTSLTASRRGPATKSRQKPTNTRTQNRSFLTSGSIRLKSWIIQGSPTIPRGTHT